MTDSIELSRRALELFEAACELDAAARTALLQETCGGDARLRAEVEALLAEDVQPSSALDEGPGLAGVIEPGPDAPREPLPLPERIGHYRVVGLLGEGGMGLVYEAEQESPRRRVALKVVHPQALSPERLKRLRREAEILGRLQHSGIAQIYEAGVDDLGRGEQPFFAMEYVEGLDLTTYAERAQLPRRARLELFVRICDAVHHAHEQGIVHRDLKPDNIIVRHDGHPVVLDFGVARAQDAGPQLTTEHTGFQKLIGTLAYMSPEQASGTGAEVDARSDVFALGVLLFELLAGVPPRQLHGLPLVVALRLVQENEPPRLQTADPSLRGELDSIVAMALEREPARRYPSARALAEDVRHFLADEPIHARPPSAIYQLRKFARRNKVLVGGVVSTLVVSVAGALVATVLAVRAAAGEREALRGTYLAQIRAAAAGLAAGDPQGAAESLDRAPEQLRSWEWEHLWSRAEGAAIPFEGTAEGTAGLAVDADGRRVFALRGDSLVCWDTATGEELAAFPTGEPLCAIARGLAGDRVAVGTAEGRALVLDAGTGERVAEYALDPEPVVALGWSPDGATLFAVQPRELLACGDGAPRLLARPPTRYAYEDLDVDPRDGAVLVVARSTERSDVGFVTLHDPADGAELARRPEASVSTTFRSPRFAPGGGPVAPIAIGGAYGNLALLDPRSLERVRRLEGHAGAVQRIAWSADGRFAYTANVNDDTVSVINAETFAVTATIPTGDAPTSIAVLPNGTQAFVSNLNSGTLTVLDVAG